VTTKLLPPPKSIMEMPNGETAPAPMAALTSEVIHPDNITHERDVQRMMAIKPGAYKKLLKQIQTLKRDLERRGFNRLIEQRKEIITQLRVIITEGKALGDDAAHELYASLNKRYKSFKAALAELEKTLVDNFKADYKRLTALERLAGVYQEAIERKKALDEENAIIEREALVYGGIIRQTWRRLPKCHHRRKINKRTVYVAPDIHYVVITPDTIYYQITTLMKGLFGKYKDVLPYGVYIENLISEETLANISAATGRQITVSIPEKGNEVHGYWIKMHRNEAPDGIITYVSYGEVMQLYPDDLTEAGERVVTRMPVPVGVGEAAKIKWVNFADYPHWLVAGYSGSGKSNLLNVILCSLISKYSPADLRLMLIDLKGGVELEHYADIPHLAVPVIDDIDQLDQRLNQMVAEMNKRFAELKRAGVKNINTYNRFARPEKRMSRLIIIIDEFNTIPGNSNTEKIYHSIIQITSKGRAAGVHMVVCTQDPRVEIVPGKIKSNLVVTITGRVRTAANSIAVIGTGEAAQLAHNPGRMMLMIGNEPQQIQTPFISDDELRESIAQAKQFAAPEALQLAAVAVDIKWTPQRVIELSIKHLGGNITWTAIKEAVEDLSQKQVRDLCETIWAMPDIEFDGVEYRIEKRSRGARYLVPVAREEKAS
jgi:energy-coupling factor transporter ATP-binding protein EcfA2